MIKLRYDWNWTEAEKSFLRAIELNPGYAPAHYWYSYALIIKGDFEKAMSEAMRARELDPDSLNSQINLSRVYYYERQNGKAIEALTKILDSSPDNKNAGYLLGITYLQAGRYNDAVNTFEKFYDNDRLYFGAQLGFAYGRINRKRDALRVLGDLEELSRKGTIIPSQEKAIIHLGMREDEKAFELFYRSCEDRFPALPFILTEFFFDGFRTDKRFMRLKNCATAL